MKHRIKNVIETLRRLPPPRHYGQVLRVPILQSTMDFTPNAEPCDKPISVITVTAERFAVGEYDKWIEWTIEL